MSINNITTIKDVPIVDVLNELGIKPDRNHKIPSPYNNGEKTPSCHIYKNSNTYYCFSNGKGGDVISLWQVSKNATFTEAIEAVAKIGGIRVEYTQQDAKARPPEPDNTLYYCIVEAATQHYQECLKKNTLAQKYLAERGIKPETIEAFRLGYADGTLAQHLTTMGYNVEDVKKVLLNEQGNDTFYKRLTFPIADKSGRVVGFTARTLTDAKPKYINSPETPIYNKQNFLYGLHLAAKQKGNIAYLVEGSTDVIALWQAGLPAIATLGTALSDRQVKALKRFQAIAIWRDGDEAGQKATLKDVAKMVAHECYPKIVKSKEQLDPDEYVRKKGIGALELTDGILYYADVKLKDTGDKPIERDDAVNEIASLLYSIPSGSLREVFARDICKNFKLNTKIFFGKLREQKPKTDTERHERSMADATNYMRIGTKFFKKIVTQNPRYNTVQIEYAKWEQTLIKEDYKMFPSFVDHIAKYDGFTVLPNYQNYKESIEVREAKYNINSKLYNLTKPLPFVPKKGNFDTIKGFLMHIFSDEQSDWETDTIGDPLTLIKDCYRIKTQLPMEMLPVICLVSKEQESGKSTILKFNKDLFGDNAVIIGNEHLRDKFNTTYADKQVVGIDENFVSIEEKTIKEKIKKMATDDEILYHPKGIDPSPLSWFGWLFLCSNDENDFMPIESTDRRFWVVKVKTPDKRDPDLRKKMMDEIPAFLDWAMHTPICHPKVTRMWFETKHIITEQMKKIAARTRPYLDGLITDYIKSVFLTYPEVHDFTIPLKELVKLINENAKWDVTPQKVSDWLEDHKHMTPGKATERCRWVAGWNDDTAEPTTSNINWCKKLGKPLHFKYQDWVDDADFESPEEQEKHKRLQTYLSDFDNIPF